MMEYFGYIKGCGCHIGLSTILWGILVFPVGLPAYLVWKVVQNV